MRAMMERLSAFLARRRWWVVGAWLLVLAVTLPLAARQTEDLTGGGFSVPGSQSAEVEKALERNWEESREGAITVVLEPSPGASAADAEAAVARMDEDVAGVSDLSVPAGASAQARNALVAGEVAVVPLSTDLPVDEQIDAAIDLREELAPGERSTALRLTSWASRPPGRGSRSFRRRTSRSAETTGFPIVALILIAAFGSLAAAALPLALGFVAVIVTGGSSTSCRSRWRCRCSSRTWLR